MKDDKGKPGNRPRLLHVREVVEEMVDERAGAKLFKAIRDAQESARLRKAKQARKEKQHDAA